MLCRARKRHFRAIQQRRVFPAEPTAGLPAEPTAGLPAAQRFRRDQHHDRHACPERISSSLSLAPPASLSPNR